MQGKPLENTSTKNGNLYGGTKTCKGKQGKFHKSKGEHSNILQTKTEYGIINM